MKRIILAMIFITFIGISGLSALRESLTFDESVHIQVGLDAWYRAIFTKDPYSPPLISEIAVIPQILNLHFPNASPIPSMAALPSRMMIVLLSVCLMTAVYLTVKKTLGEPEALASIFLFAWEPSMLAHSHYVTKDVGFTLFFFCTWISFLALCKKLCLRSFIIFSVLFGCMLASKTSAVPFFVSSLLALLFFNPQYGKKILTIGWRWIPAMGIGLTIVWATYFFQTDVVIAARDDPQRISAQLMRYARQTNNSILTSALLFGTEVKIPLGSYLASQKNALLLQRNQETVFFLGYEYPSVRWYMIIVNLLMKLPIPIIVLFGMGIFWFKQKQLQFRQYIPFIAPIIGICAFLGLSHVRPYVRYLLPIYPFFCIISGISLTKMVQKNWLVFPAFLCVWYTIGTLTYFPHFISYANIFAGVRNAHYTKLIDSNIDWGQGLMDIAAYIKRNDISHLKFSYFGTDDGALYGLSGMTPYGFTRFEDICMFHDIKGTDGNGKSLVAISSFNWYYCGYYKMPDFKPQNCIGKIGDTTLLFNTDPKEIP